MVSHPIGLWLLRIGLEPLIAVGRDGSIMAPCGRCREFISQIHNENMNAEVMVGEGEILTIRELLPYDWRR
jgi:cytidine deaminase